MKIFNNHELSTYYIKALLKSFNLPTCNVWIPGMKIYKDAFYIYNNTISKSLVTGNPTNFNDNFKVIFEDYKFGNKVLNFTKVLNSNSFDYDSYTHDYLGNYLRFIRDYKGLDLMPLYNCFSNKEVTDLTIKSSIGETLIETNEDCKVYMINVNPFTEYTLYIDSVEPVELVAGYYDNGLIDIFNLLETNSSLSFPYEVTYQKYPKSSFNKPLLYDKLSSKNLEENWKSVLNPIVYSQRQNLKLFIKVANITSTSSIVLLEGNYLKNSIMHFDNIDYKIINKIQGIPYSDEDISKPVKKYLYDQNEPREILTKLGLVKFNTGNSYPFSNRLLEYLYNNVISQTDDIDNNILRVQRLLYGRTDKEVNLSTSGLDGIWSNSIRNVLYGIAKNNKDILNNKFDILGYCDKDLEQLIKLEDKD